MKKFVGVRSLENIIKRAKSKGYIHYEKDNHDRLRKDGIDVCLRSNGRFLVYKNDECIANERSEELDNEGWYQELLDIVYVGGEENE